MCWISCKCQQRQQMGTELQEVSIFIIFSVISNTLILLLTTSPTGWEKRWLKPHSDSWDTRVGTVWLTKLARIHDASNTWSVILPVHVRKFSGAFSLTCEVTKHRKQWLKLAPLVERKMYVLKRQSDNQCENYSCKTFNQLYLPFSPNHAGLYLKLFLPRMCSFHTR